MCSDEDIPPRTQRASGFHPPAPVIPNGSESDPDADDEEKKVDRSYVRPRIQWDRNITMNKGASEMDDD
jgi:hypothetical protein